MSSLTGQVAIYSYLHKLMASVAVTTTRRWNLSMIVDRQLLIVIAYERAEAFCNMVFLT